MLPSVGRRLQLLAKITGQRVIETTAKDPFICSRCGGELMLWKIWHPSYGVIYDEEERIKTGHYDGDKRGRDPDVRDIRHPLLQLSLPAGMRLKYLSAVAQAGKTSGR